jgi:hypothetical protein
MAERGCLLELQTKIWQKVGACWSCRQKYGRKRVLVGVADKNMAERGCLLELQTKIWQKEGACWSCGQKYGRKRVLRLAEVLELQTKR